MHKKFEINWTKIKGGCLSRGKVATHNTKSDLPIKTLKDYYEISKTITVSAKKPSSYNCSELNNNTRHLTNLKKQWFQRIDFVI